MTFEELLAQSGVRNGMALPKMAWPWTNHRPLC
jgi:hypothetical protein